jgi:hypothetical protein
VEDGHGELRCCSVSWPASLAYVIILSRHTYDQLRFPSQLCPPFVCLHRPDHYLYITSNWRLSMSFLRRHFCARATTACFIFRFLSILILQSFFLDQFVFRLPIYFIPCTSLPSHGLKNGPSTPLSVQPCPGCLAVSLWGGELGECNCCDGKKGESPSDEKERRDERTGD